MIEPIDGQPFKNCADCCTLLIRLLLRDSSCAEVVQLTRKEINECLEFCSVWSDDYKFRKTETPLVDKFHCFEAALKEIDFYTLTLAKIDSGSTF